jgi:hypothetical protein
MRLTSREWVNKVGLVVLLQMEWKHPKHEIMAEFSILGRKKMKSLQESGTKL